MHISPDYITIDFHNNNTVKCYSWYTESLYQISIFNDEYFIDYDVKISDINFLRRIPNAKNGIPPKIEHIYAIKNGVIIRTAEAYAGKTGFENLLNSYLYENWENAIMIIQ